MRAYAVTNRCLLLVVSVVTLLLTVNVGHGQDDCATYQLVPRTSFKTQPKVVSGIVNETVMKSEMITTYKPVWTREKRERKTVVMKPIVNTSERVERFLVRRPIVETSYRERQVEETSYETVTEYKEQRYLVEKPIVETQLREEQVVVRKPVTTTVMQSENVTTLKPVTIAETELVADSSIRNDLVLLTGRNRLRRLPSGYYVDPLTGLTDFRRRGLRWVPDQTLAVQPTLETTLIPREVRRTAYAPETVEVRKPVQVTRYVDQVETRKVPVQVATKSRKIETMRIPVTVRKPVIKIKTERVPFEEVKYREEVYERRIPVTETTYQRVMRVEPYEVEVCKWVAETKEVRVPKTVARRVEYSVDQVIPETTWQRVPVDAWGNIIGSAQSVSSPADSGTSLRIAERIRNAPITQTSLKPIIDISERSTVIGTPIVRKLSSSEAARLIAGTKPNSILVPETTITGPVTDITKVLKRPTMHSIIEQPVTDTVEVQKRDTVEVQKRPTQSSEHEYPFVEREIVETDASQTEMTPSIEIEERRTPADLEPTLLDEVPTVQIESNTDAEINERPGR